jgi:hypothetical protein
MRILIDEYLDWRLKREFPGHTAMTVTDMGWGGIKNGALLSLAQSQFDVFISGDKKSAIPAKPVELFLGIRCLVGRFNTSCRYTSISSKGVGGAASTRRRYSDRY